MNYMHPYTNSCTNILLETLKQKRRQHLTCIRIQTPKNYPKTKNSPEILTCFPNFHQLLGLRKFRNETLMRTFEKTHIKTQGECKINVCENYIMSRSSCMCVRYRYKIIIIKLNENKNKNLT